VHDEAALEYSRPRTLGDRAIFVVAQVAQLQVATVVSTRERGMSKGDVQAIACLNDCRTVQASAEQDISRSQLVHAALHAALRHKAYSIVHDRLGPTES
jgi:hypothetical protein